MRPALLAALLLAACASRESPVVSACEGQVNRDPEVEHLQAASAGSETFALQHHTQLHDARQQAELRCLRARGDAPASGVEAPKRSYNLFDGLF